MFKRKNTGLIVAAAFLIVLGGIHLLRLFTQFDVVVASYSIPLAASVVAMLISWLFAAWLLYLRRAAA